MQELCFLRGPCQEVISNTSLQFSSTPYGGGVEYIHRNTAVVGGDEMGNLASETVKYSQESHGILTRE
jgi:hypothetical protein